MNTILIVDDEAIVSAHLDEVLSGMGYEVVGRASSGESAVDMAKNLRPDVILMDIVMPGTIDGITAATEIRKSVDSAVVFLTAYADERIIRRAAAADPYAYLIKPFREQELRACIEVALNKKGRYMQLENLLEKYHHVINSLAESIILTDSDGTVVYWSDGAAHNLGHHHSEMIGSSYSTLFEPSSQRIIAQSFTELIMSNKDDDNRIRLSTRCIHKERRLIPVECSLQSMHTRDGERLCMFVLRHPVEEEIWPD
ncbi:MAG: response regulator [Vulcanimicrobiota bacterium]